MSYVAARERTRVNLAKLDDELHVRGWSKAELAATARLHPDTISAVYRTGSATPRSFRRITQALAEHEPVSGARELLEASA